MESDKTNAQPSDTTEEEKEVEKTRADVKEVVEPVKDFAPLQALNLIYFNLSEAQKNKGKFTLQDSKAVLTSYRLLSSFLKARLAWETEHSDGSDKGKEEGEKEKKEPKADESILQSVRIMISATEVMQTTGIFSMEGAEQLLDALGVLSEYTESLKSAEVKFAEKKKEKKDKRRGKK